MIETHDALYCPHAYEMDILSLRNKVLVFLILIPI